MKRILTTIGLLVLLSGCQGYEHRGYEAALAPIHAAYVQAGCVKAAVETVPCRKLSRTKQQVYNDYHAGGGSGGGFNYVIIMN